MPISLRKFNAQVKDPETGDMIPAGLLSSDALGAINSAKTDAVAAVEGKQAVAEAAVELKGQTTLASIPDDYTSLSNEVDEVKSAVNVVVENSTDVEWTLVTKEETTVPTIGGYLTATGNITQSSGYITILFYIQDDSLVYADISTSFKRFAVYSSSEPSASTLVRYYGSGNDVPTSENPAEILAGQYVAITARPNSSTDYTANIYVGIQENTYDLQSELMLTTAMNAQVEAMIHDSVEASKGNPTSISALLYRRNLPSYYLEAPAVFTSFEDDEYIQKRIDAIPKGKHFIFVTDTHWDSNAKLTNDLIAYVRSRIGNVDVIFGGDVVNANNYSYGAVKVIKDYFNESITAYGNRFLPVIGNHDTNQVGDRETTKEERFVPYSVLAGLFTRHLDGRAILRDETDAIATKTDDPTVAAEYDAYFKLNYVVNTDNGITFIVYNTGATGVFNREVFGLNGEDEIYLHQKWLYDMLMQVPDGNDVVLVGHEATYGKNNPLNSWNHRSAVALMCGFAAKKNIKLYLPDAVINENTAPWVPNSQYPAYDFTNAPNAGKIFMMQGHWHHDFVVKVGIKADQSGYNYTQLVVDSWDGTESFTKASGEIPIITTVCDAYNTYIKNESYPTDPADWDMKLKLGTVEEQAFDVVTITDAGIVTTRFGAAEHPGDMLREFEIID